MGLIWGKICHLGNKRKLFHMFTAVTLFTYNAQWSFKISQKSLKWIPRAMHITLWVQAGVKFPILGPIRAFSKHSLLTIIAYRHSKFEWELCKHDFRPILGCKMTHFGVNKSFCKIWSIATYFYWPIITQNFKNIVWTDSENKGDKNLGPVWGTNVLFWDSGSLFVLLFFKKNGICNFFYKYNELTEGKISNKKDSNKNCLKTCNY